MCRGRSPGRFTAGESVLAIRTGPAYSRPSFSWRLTSSRCWGRSPFERPRRNIAVGAGARPAASATASPLRRYHAMSALAVGIDVDVVDMPAGVRALGGEAEGDPGAFARKDGEEVGDHRHDKRGRPLRAAEDPADRQRPTDSHRVVEEHVDAQRAGRGAVGARKEAQRRMLDADT